MTESENKIVHDFLLENRPDGSEHDPSVCVHCKETASLKEDDMAENMLSHEQHEALLASAVAKAIEEAANAARASADAEIIAQNEKLAGLEKAIADLAAENETLKADIVEREESVRIAELATERAKLVTSVASFSDEQVEKRRVEWAKMSEEAFASYLEDIRSVASAAGNDQTPRYDGTRETATEHVEDAIELRSSLASLLRN